MVYLVNLLTYTTDTNTFKLMSQPYIIIVENTTATTIKDINLFDTFKNNGLPNFGLPIGVNVTMGVQGVTYGQLLFQSMSMPFLTSLTYLVAGSTEQVNQSFSIKAKDTNGNMQNIPCSSVVSPYQSQGNVLQASCKYIIDGNTVFIISNLLPNSTFKIYIYPSKISNISNSFY
jgi:hypothetical protein|tara:strand:+ start:56 stop:577 length:522 start_codon:yes stop_codon:yes gene_type:complete